MLRFSPCLFRWTTHHSESSISSPTHLLEQKKPFEWRVPPPQLIIHCGHTKSKHLHQLAFALIPFIAASEPWFFGWGGRKGEKTHQFTGNKNDNATATSASWERGELRKGKLQTFSGRWLPVVRVCAHVWDPFQRNSAPEKPVRSTRWLWITMGYFHPLSVW